MSAATEPLQAVVLAGGLATRMKPRTLTTPKSMLEVAGRPFIDWQLERLAQQGFSRVVLCTGHLGEQIRAHVGAARFGLTVTYSEEGPTLLGTLGAVRAALHLLEGEFLLTYGDSLLPFDYAGPLRLLRAHPDAEGVMSVFRNDGRWDTSNVETDGVWVNRYQKGQTDPALTFIDYGAIALRKSTLAKVPESTAGDLSPLLGQLAAQHRLRAHVAEKRFYEIGSPEGLAALEQVLLQGPLA